MKVLVIGAGAYGLALSSCLIDKNDVIVYSSRKEEIIDLNNNYSNDKLFPNVKLSNKIKFTNELNLNGVELVVLAIPSNYFISVINDLKDKISKETFICIATKGLVNNNYSYDIVRENLDVKGIFVLSGPSFGIDLVKRENIILTVAGDVIFKDIFSDNIKIEVTNDLIGVQLCGVLKNIFAIGSGILDGLGVSESTKAAYITRIINETKNIIVDLNGDKDTINCACGIGDIILTCGSTTSRNFTFGYLIGSNDNYIDYKNNYTVEGIDALDSIMLILNKSSEVINIIYNIVNNNMNPDVLLDYIIK
ncbi:MAG: NAD(P)-binding domain-containing protein [Bacilli bacterium]|nr:NAD(P)-binding domain-containing protein [Bacilli bacterium]